MSDFESNSGSKQGTRASERVSTQRRKTNRTLRTILLGTLAMIGGVIWLGDQYGVEREETLSLLVASAGFVGALVLAGVLGAVLIWLLRRLLKSGKK
jgi:uncharacterized membrane protein YdjX (TVP38/TMEM64 family)